MRPSILRDAAAVLSDGYSSSENVFMCRAVETVAGRMARHQFVTLLLLHDVSLSGNLAYIKAGETDYESSRQEIQADFLDSPSILSQTRQEIRFMFLHFLAYWLETP